MLESRKGKISLREEESYSYSGIMLGIRKIIGLSSKLSGVSFHTRNRLPRFKLNCRVRLVNYLLSLLLLLLSVFGNKKGIRESDEEKCGLN